MSSAVVGNTLPIIHNQQNYVPWRKNIADDWTKLCLEGLTFNQSISVITWLGEHGTGYFTYRVRGSWSDLILWLEKEEDAIGCKLLWQ